MNEFDQIVELKKLFVPEYLLCSITNELMAEPVTIESGRTYERASLDRWFALQREKAVRLIDEADSDIEEERNLTTEDFLICPVTMQKVDPSVMISNKYIKDATEHYLDQNPWAYEFDPSEDFMKISLQD